VVKPLQKGISYGFGGIAVLLATTSLGAGGAAAAPQTDGKSAAMPVDDIVVTARRKEERIDKVPVSVSVVSSDVIRRQNLTSVQDVQYLAPSLNVSTNTARSSNNYTLRGQGTTYGTDPSVVAYFAEVPVPGGGNGSGALFDMGSVQVLNGPQGTLFGRNSVGGAILFSPARPTNEPGGYARVGYGNYSNFQQEAVANVPLMDDKLLLRAGIWHRTRDGFTRDTATGRDYDNINATAGRVSLLFKPGGGIENLFILNFSENREHGTGTVISRVNPDGLAAFLFPTLPAIAAQQAVLGPRHTAQTPGVSDHQRMLQLINTTTIPVTDDIALKNIISYTQFRSNVSSDVSGTQLPILYFQRTPDWGGPQNNNQPAINQFTEELQLSGSIAEKALQWTVGGYFQHNAPIHTLQSLVAFGGPAVLTDRGDRLRSLAGFAQGTLDVGALVPALQGLKITGGYRYSSDRRRDYVDSYTRVGESFTTGGSCALTTGNYPDCRLDYARSFSASTYTAAVEYQLAPSTMIYFTARSGFKSGGFNLGAPPSSGFAAFEPEKVKDIEAGIKSRLTLRDTALQFNLAAFRDKYTDIQRPLLKNFDGIVTTYVINATSAVIKGIEAQASVRLPLGLTFSGAYSYTDSHYGTFLTDQGDFTGFPLPYTPKHKVSATAEYARSLGAENGDLRLGVNYTYQTSYRNLDVLDPDVRVPAYGLLNLSAGWERIMGTPIDLELYARNITNKLYVIGMGNYYYSLGFTTNVYGEPRMFGGSLTYHFGK